MPVTTGCDGWGGLVIATMAWLAVASPVRAQAPEAFYVATGGRDSWSGRLAAPDAAGTDGPFATLDAAQAAMRATAAGRLTYVRDGAYFLANPVRIGKPDDGERIIAYPGEHPVLYGGLPVVQWHAWNGEFLAPLPAPVARDAGLPQLFTDGARLPNARFPPAGPGEDQAEAWFFADVSPHDIDPHRGFRVRLADMAVFAAAENGALVGIFGQRGWQEYVLPISQADATTRIVTLDGRSWDEIGEGSRFALLNAPVTPGTWRLDPSSNTLHLRVDTAPLSAAIVVATLPCIVSIDQARDVTLAGLRLVGSATEGAAICLSRTQHVTLDGLDIAGTGDGIRLDRATDTRVTGVEIARTGGFGITLRHRSDATVARGNWLHDIGWLHQDSSAIWFDASSGNIFAQNRIENVAKFGIGGGSLTEGGAYDNIVEGNEIDRANQRTSDGGGIMVIGWAQDATRDVIRGNFVSNTTALGNTGWDGKPHVTFQDPVTRLVSQAIYLDDWASGLEVSANLLCGNIGGIDLHAGWDNRVFGNVLIGNAGIALGVDAENWLGHGAHPHPMEHNSIEHNTVILDRPSNGQSGATALRGGPGAATFDHNVYAGTGLNDASFHHVPDEIWSAHGFGIDAWRRLGQDTGSSVGAGQVVLRDEAVRMVGTMDPPPPLPLGAIGRPRDRAGLAERVRRRCGLP